MNRAPDLTLYLKAELGSDRDRVAEQLVGLSGALLVRCAVEFNGEPLVAEPGQTPDEVRARYERAVRITEVTRAAIARSTDESSQAGKDQP